MKNRLPFTVLFDLLFSACKKDLRTKIYLLRAYNNSGLTDLYYMQKPVIKIQ